MTENNPFKAIKKWAISKKGRCLKEPPKPEELKLSAHKKEYILAVEASTPRRSYQVWTLIHESAGADLEMLMIKIRERTGKKPKQVEALKMAIQALKDQYKI